MNELILKLINEKHEGETCDFKQEHHKNKASLLHDILSMTNQVNNKDRFIIYGVTDHTEGCRILGVKDDPNRRNQNSIINFLMDKSFAADIRPEIELKSLNIENSEIDVLIIHPIRKIPCFLTNDYKNMGKIVRAYHIYIRTCDTNTPINKSCDMYNLELLWRKRFGIDSTSLEKFKDLLDEVGNWDIDIGNKKVAYHKFFPQYRIEFGETKEFYEPFSGSYLNVKSFLGSLELKYNNTTLYQTDYWYLDEMRLCIPEAISGNISNIDSGYYWYFIENDLKGKLLKLFTNGRMNFTSRGTGGSQFLLYHTDEKRIQFENFINLKPTIIENIEPDIDAKEARKHQLKKKQLTKINPIIISKIKNVYEKWNQQMNDK